MIGPVEKLTWIVYLKEIWKNNLILLPISKIYSSFENWKIDTWRLLDFAHRVLMMFEALCIQETKHLVKAKLNRAALDQKLTSLLLHFFFKRSQKVISRKKRCPANSSRSIEHQFWPRADFSKRCRHFATTETNNFEAIHSFALKPKIDSSSYLSLWKDLICSFVECWTPFFKCSILPINYG